MKISNFNTIEYIFVEIDDLNPSGPLYTYKVSDWSCFIVNIIKRW